MISFRLMICVIAHGRPFPTIYQLNSYPLSSYATSIACSWSDTSYMSTVSLKHSTPFPLKNPSTPSGVVCLLGWATCKFACVPLSATLSVISLTSTRPAVLMLSISAGARSSRRELQIRPMKLLSRAICTASLTEIVVRPLLWIVWVRPDGDWAESAPSSLHRNTGSEHELV